MRDNSWSNKLDLCQFADVDAKAIFDIKTTHNLVGVQGIMPLPKGHFLNLFM
jgi:hypothetical protein